MTEYEALAYEIGVRQNYENITDEGWEIIADALLKQTPRKPKDCYIDSTKKVNWVCNCGVLFISDKNELPKYCDECGQKLDFSGIWR